MFVRICVRVCVGPTVRVSATTRAAVLFVRELWQVVSWTTRPPCRGVTDLSSLYLFLWQRTCHLILLRHAADWVGARVSGEPRSTCLYTPALLIWTPPIICLLTGGEAAVCAC